MQHHPPRFLLAGHDEANGMHKVWFQFSGLFETVVDDLGMSRPAVPTLAGADAMKFPFGKFVGQVHESFPQLANTLDFKIAADIEDLLCWRSRFALLVDGLKRLGIGAVETCGKESA